MGEAVAVAPIARLLLRSWPPDDLAGLVAMDTDPEVMRCIGAGTVPTLEQVAGPSGDFCARRSERASGCSPYTIGRAASCWAGPGCSCRASCRRSCRSVEAGWRLRRTAWGRGIATEAARAALGSLLPQVDLSREGGELVSIRQPGNIASERVMLKLGFVRSPAHVADGRDLVVHRARPDELVLV